MLIAGCSNSDISPATEPINVPQQETYAEGYYPGTEYLVIEEGDLEPASQDVPAGTRVVRTHTFSNGYEHTWITVDGYVRLDDIIVASVEEHEKMMQDYEASIKNSKEPGEITTSGAMKEEHCAVSVPFWCAALIGRAWKDGIVPYYIVRSRFTSDEINKIEDAIAEIEAASGVDFQEKTDSRGDRIVIREEHKDDCSSWMGRKGGGRQYLNLGRNCLAGEKGKGVAIHELLHALEMMHEHQRSDRNEFINILTPFNYKYFNVKVTFSMATKTTYDYGSIMHYPRQIDEQRVFSTMSFTGTVGQRDGLSTLDRIALNQRYPR